MGIDFEVSLLGLLYIAVAVICYAAGWCQAKTVGRLAPLISREVPERVGDSPSVVASYEVQVLAVDE